MKVRDEITKREKKFGTVMVNCKCKSKYQDERYGIGMRVANMQSSDKHKGKATCTVCGSEKSIS